jgi:hypothetical protein
LINLVLILIIPILFFRLSCSLIDTTLPASYRTIRVTLVIGSVLVYLVEYSAIILQLYSLIDDVSHSSLGKVGKSVYLPFKALNVGSEPIFIGRHDPTLLSAGLQLM